MAPVCLHHLCCFVAERNLSSLVHFLTSHSASLYTAKHEMPTNSRGTSETSGLIAIASPKIIAFTQDASPNTAPAAKPMSQSFMTRQKENVAMSTTTAIDIGKKELNALSMNIATKIVAAIMPYIAT